MIERSMHVIAVRNLTETSAYHRDVLGFTVRQTGDDGWRIFERDGCRIMAGHCPDAVPAHELGDHAYFAYLVLDDANAFHTEVTANRAEIIKPLRDEPWGMREFGIRTPDGHRLLFGQDID